MTTRLALVVLLAAAGCGSSGVDQLAGASDTPTPATSTTASPAPLRRPTPSPAPATLRPTATVTVLRDGDAGSTIHMRVGQRIRVQLQQGTWDPPTSSADRVVAPRSSTGGYPTDQPVDALFEAVAPGTADLGAQSDAACFHTEPRCLMPTQLWQVHVVVT
jgi:hypothetical protein